MCVYITSVFSFSTHSEWNILQKKKAVNSGTGGRKKRKKPDVKVYDRYTAVLSFRSRLSLSFIVVVVIFFTKKESRMMYAFPPRHSSSRILRSCITPFFSPPLSCTALQLIEGTLRVLLLLLLGGGRGCGGGGSTIVGRGLRDSHVRHHGIRSSPGGASAVRLLGRVRGAGANPHAG